MIDWLLRLAACLAAIALAGTDVGAQSSRTIKIVVPYPPASGPDILSRMMAEQIGRTKNGPTMVIENRPGGGTIVGNEAAARAAPDGNTVLLVANSFTLSTAFKRGNYDAVKSFDPVCYLAATPMVLVVQGSSPYKTLADLITAAKTKPGVLAFAAANASSLHVAFEVIKRSAGINMTFVPFNGTAPAINTLMGGHVEAVFADYPTVVGHLKSGTLRGLVTASGKRISTLPDVPTYAEAGIAPYAADIFYGIVAPARTPADELAKLSNWFSTALKAAEVQPRLAQQGLFPVGMCGAAFGDFMRGITEDYVRILRDVNIKLE